MFIPIKRYASPLLILAAALAMTPLTAAAQNGAQRNQADDSKRCEVANNTAAQQGKAGDADMESTYSSCRLLDGYVGFGARINDGTGETAGYGKDDATPDLRKPSFAGRNHSLGMLTEEEDGAGNNGRGGKVRTFTANRVGTDAFSQKEKFPDWQGEHAPDTIHLYSPQENTRLLASRDVGGDMPAAGGGVGGGGAAGGLDSGRTNTIPPITPPIPAVPEPATYLMLLSGIGLLVFATRRKSRK